MRKEAKDFALSIPLGTDRIIKANGSNWLVYICSRPAGWAHRNWHWVRVYAKVFDEVLAVQCKLALFTEGL
jgi:hypothetical protein